MAPPHHDYHTNDGFVVSVHFGSALFPQYSLGPYDFGAFPESKKEPMEGVSFLQDQPQSGVQPDAEMCSD